MMENERQETRHRLKYTLLGSVLASTAIFASQEILKKADDTDTDVSIGTGEVVCDEEPVIVKFGPTNLDDQFYSGDTQIRAYNPENSDNPSGFYITVKENKDPKEYEVGVSSINEEGVSGLSLDFLDGSPFSGFDAVDFSFSANQGFWTVDVDPQDGTVSVAGTCLDQPGKGESVSV